MVNRRERLSGVELFKIIAIFLIVVNHVTQTLGYQELALDYNGYVIPLGIASKNIQIVILNLFRQCGALGNCIFFICSAWFLVGKEGHARKKAFDLVCSVWFISIAFLIGFLLLYSPGIEFELIIRSIFPTCFENNWYMTCYILFLFIYPWLNKFIKLLNKSDHLRIVCFSTFLWVIINSVKSDWFFSSYMLLWATFYFLISYLKIYCPNVMSNRKVGIWLLIIGIIGAVCQVVVTNYVGLNLFSIFSDKVLRMNSDRNPFFLLIAIGGLIISLQFKFKSKYINYISGLSLFTYLTHENILFRSYARPYIWHLIYTNFGYSYVVLWDLLFSFVLFIISLSISVLYKEYLHKYVLKFSSCVYELISKLYTIFSRKMLKIE